MANNLYQFKLHCGRAGRLEGLFIASPEEVEAAYGKEVCFGEVLGKHSEVVCELDESMVTLKSEDQEFVAKLYTILGTSVSGFNPFDYIESED